MGIWLGSSSMTLLFNWAESDYVSAYWAWLLRRPWKTALGFWYSLLILVMVVVGAIRNTQNWRRQLVYAAIALGAAVLGFYGIHSRLWG
jgi:hypothetical protein